MPDVVPFYRDRLNDPQRRRLEVLIAVSRLFPSSMSGFSQREAAQWITTGRWEK